MIWNVIFIIGIIVAIIGGLLLIRFDGEVKRIIVALILVVLGGAAAITGKVMGPKPT